MAGKIPPARPRSEGGWVRNSQLKAGSPLMTMSWRMNTRIAITITDAVTSRPKAIFSDWYRVILCFP